MPRAGLDTEAIVSAAEKLADAEGLEAVTLATLARQLGVRPPSLYAHVSGLPDLRRRLAARAARRLAATLQAAAAGRARADALAAVAQAYRSYAREHPGSYAALQRAPDPDDADTIEAAAQAVDVVLAVLRGYGLESDDAIHATRIIRASLHGFVSLEASKGFGLPLDIDETFARLTQLLDRGSLHARPSTRRDRLLPERETSYAAPVRVSQRQPPTVTAREGPR
jgi:AcrR family transcriptional regulator